MSVTASANLITGEITLLDVALTTANVYSVAGVVLRADNSMPIPNANIAVLSVNATYQTVTNANGEFTIPAVIGGIYDIVAGSWGFRYKVQNQNITTNQPVVLKLDKGYQDDFVFDYGWQQSGSSAEGIWERTDAPKGIDVGIVVAPFSDALGDVGFSCYVTGNSTNEVDVDDVENGTSILTSPIMDLSNYTDPRITAQVWCVSASISGDFPDSIKIYVSNGTQEKLAWQRKGENLAWQLMMFDVTAFVPVSNTVRIRIVGFDDPAGTDFDTYEAAFDKFKVTGITVGTEELATGVTLQAMPNPFSSLGVVAYDGIDHPSSLKVYDLAGRPVQSFDLQGDTGKVEIGSNLPNGIYMVRIEQNGQVSKPLKVVKIN